MKGGYSPKIITIHRQKKQQKQTPIDIQTVSSRKEEIVIQTFVEINYTIKYWLPPPICIRPSTRIWVPSNKPPRISSQWVWRGESTTEVWEEGGRCAVWQGLAIPPTPSPQPHTHTSSTHYNDFNYGEFCTRMVSTVSRQALTDVSTTPSPMSLSVAEVKNLPH